MIKRKETKPKQQEKEQEAKKLKERKNNIYPKKTEALKMTDLPYKVHNNKAIQVCRLN